VCIDDKPRLYPECVLNEGDEYTVIEMSPPGLGYILLEVKSPYNWHGGFLKDRFRRVDDNPYSEDCTAELAQSAMNVRDTADQPVREIVNN